MEEIRSKYQIDTSAVGGIVVYSLTQFVVNRLLITQNDWLSCALHALILKKKFLSNLYHYGNISLFLVIKFHL